MVTNKPAKPALLNKKYKNIIIVAVVLTLVIRLFLLDAFIKMSIVAAGEAAFGAKVSVRSAHLEVLKGHLTLRHIEVGDKGQPMRNLVTIELADLDVGTAALLESQVHVQNLQVSGISFGQPRKTSALLKKPKPPKKSAKPSFIQKQANQQVNAAVAYYSWDAISERLGINDLMDTRSLALLKTIDSAQQDVKNRPSQLQASLASPDVSAQIALVQTQWNKLQAATPTDLRQIPAYLGSLDQLRRQLISTNALIADKQKLVSDETTHWNGQMSEIQNQYDQDMRIVQDKLSTLQQKTGTVVQDVVGPRYVGMLDQAKGYLAVLQRFKKKKAASPWYTRIWVKGDDITFPMKHRRPKVLIEHVQCDGVMGLHNDRFIGTIDEIASDQNVRGIPLTLQFKTKDAQSPRQFSLIGQLDLRGDKRLGEATVKQSGFDLASAYWDVASVPIQIESGTYSTDATFGWNDGNIEAHIGLTTQATHFKTASHYDAGNLFHGLIWTVAQKTPVVSLYIDYQNNVLALKSNLDGPLQAGMNQMLDSQKAKLMAQVQLEWDAKVKSQMDRLTKAGNDSTKGIQNQFGNQQKQWTQQMDQLSKAITSKQKTLQDQVGNQINSGAQKLQQNLKQLVPKLF